MFGQSKFSKRSYSDLEDAEDGMGVSHIVAAQAKRKKFVPAHEVTCPADVAPDQLIYVGSPAPVSRHIDMDVDSSVSNLSFGGSPSTIGRQLTASSPEVARVVYMTWQDFQRMDKSLYQGICIKIVR